MSNTNQAYIFTRKYQDRKDSSVITKILTASLEPSQIEPDISNTDPETGAPVESECHFYNDMIDKTLDAAYESIETYVSENNAFPSIGVMVMLLKKFKSIRLGNIFQALSLYSSTIRVYDIDTKNKLDRLKNSEDKDDQHRYNNALNLHATMLLICSNYLVATKNGNKNQYKITLLKEALKPMYDYRSKTINFIKTLCASADIQNKNDPIGLLLRNVLNEFKSQQSKRNNCRKSWSINDLASKIDDLSPNSLIILSKLISNYWYQDREDGFDSFEVSLTPMLEEQSFLNYFKSEMSATLFSDVESYIRGDISSIPDSDHNSDQVNNVVKMFDQWLHDKIADIYNEFCPDHSATHTFILNSYIRHLLTECRFGSKETLDDDDRALRLENIDLAGKIISKNSKENITNPFFQYYVTDINLLSSLYLIYNKRYPDSTPEMYDIWDSEDLFVNALKCQLKSIKSASDNYRMIQLSLFRLLNLYEYIFFYHKNKNVSKEKPAPYKDKVKDFLGLIDAQMREIFKSGKKYSKHNLVLRKMLQLHFYNSKQAMYEFWDKCFNIPGIDLSKRDISLFISLSAKDLPGDDNKEDENKTTKCFFHGLEKGYFMCSTKCPSEKDVEDKQRNNGDSICVTDNLVVIDSHDRDPARYGGSYYSTQSVSLIKVMVREVLKIVWFKEDLYNEYLASLSAFPLVKKCANLIWNEYRASFFSSNVASGKKFQIKIITGGKAANYKKIEVAVKAININSSKARVKDDNDNMYVSP
ncbi:MAG: hypothetical protein VX335_04585 [Pseudomonadota bacterium]|nr:hypothetical protein [Pseudomonadota bacterium]